MTKAFFDKSPRKILCDAEKGTKVRSAKSEVSMRAGRTLMRAALQGASVVIPEISQAISHIIKKNPAIGFVSGAPLHF